MSETVGFNRTPFYSSCGERGLRAVHIVYNGRTFLVGAQTAKDFILGRGTRESFGQVFIEIEAPSPHCVFGKYLEVGDKKLRDELTAHWKGISYGKSNWADNIPTPLEFSCW